MRERWVDDGSGTLTIRTDKLYVRLHSNARKNYHTAHSNWSLTFGVNGKYGYACRSYHQFGGTFDEALERVETIFQEIYAVLSEMI